ncbi:MAG: hypothetical protein LBC74_01600, partial [Planctomycetaceae bacterium]|nr:hypothetical protein [Planctomycetaceae bacterium]
SGIKEFEVEFENKKIDSQPANSKYTFSLANTDFLTYGFQMAEFTGNWHKDNDVKPDSNVYRNNNPDIDDGAEIWTQLYEYAWAKHKGELDSGEHVSGIWPTLTRRAAKMIDTSGMSNQQILNEINNARKNDQWVCVATKFTDTFTVVGRYAGNLAHGLHSYYVKDIIETGVPNNQSLRLINPWGYDPNNTDNDKTVILLRDDMKVIYKIYVLDAVK